MKGNKANNVIALYNIDYNRLFIDSKWAVTTCRVFEHELFYTSYGISRFSLQSEIRKPILRVQCDYGQSNVCLQPLLHTLDSSSYESQPPNLLGRSGYVKSKMYLYHGSYLADLWLNGSSNYFINKPASSREETVTTNEIKFIINFPTLTLIQGIWWSNAYPESARYKVITSIKTIEFTFPDSMGGGEFKSEALKDFRKPISHDRKDLEIKYLSSPILTNRLTFTSFGYQERIRDRRQGHILKFSMELFGCSNYKPDISNFPLNFLLS